MRKRVPKQVFFNRNVRLSAARRICSVPSSRDSNNIHFENNLVAVLTCCGFQLAHLIGNRLQPWKKIDHEWGVNQNNYCHLTWMMNTGRIFCISDRREQHVQEYRRNLFIIETQTANVETRDLARELNYVSLLERIWHASASLLD